MKQAEEIKNVIEQNIIEFKNISEKEWTIKSNPGKWSKKETLGHLIDSALNNQRRFIVCQYEQGTKIIYLQDEWVKLQFYQAADVNDLIELWRLLNLQIARIVENIPVDKLKNLCDTGKAGYEPHDIDFLITDYIAHLRHHLQQIAP